MFGLSGAIKAVAALVIVLVIAAGLWYVTDLKAALVTSQQNELKLEEAVAKQNALVESMQQDIAQIQETNKQLQALNSKLQEDANSLAKKFDKRDFGVFAAEKPAVTEKLINRGTKNAMRCLEIASGSPLTEAEKNAKSPLEANRECPSLIDPNYNSVIK